MRDARREISRIAYPVSRIGLSDAVASAFIGVHRRFPVSIFPRHPVTRLVALLWLLASLAMLVVTFARPEIQGGDRSALVYLTPLYFLSFPLGHLGLMAGIEIRVELYVTDHVVPSVFAEGLYLWASLTLLGYLQWFVLLPWIAGKCGQLSRSIFDGGRDPDAGKAGNAAEWGQTTVSMRK